MNDTETNSGTNDSKMSVDLAELANVAMERIAEHAITHPLRTLGIAAGVGYTLGGGLPKFVVRLGMIFGARVVTNALVTASLERLGGATLDVEEDHKGRGVEASNGASKRHTSKRGDRRRSAGHSTPSESHD